MAGEVDDAQLMMRYAAGDVVAFEALYTRHNGPLYRYFARQCGSIDNADELFQNVWLRIITARARYEPKARFTTSMYRIAHNCLVDHYRKSGRALTSGARELTAAARDPVAEEVDPAFASNRWALVDWEKDPPDTAPGPEAALSVAQRAERLRAALAALPAEQQEAFLLHEEAEMGLAEIAAVTDSNAETVKSRLRYAVKKLRTALGDLKPADSPGAVS